MAIVSRRILVLYWHRESIDKMRAGIRHHLRALEHSKVKYEILYYNTVSGAPEWLRHLNFDVVVMHTTFLCMRWSYLFYHWKWVHRWIRDLECVKIAMPQDEYDHSEILDEWLYEWGVSVIFTNFDECNRKILYPIMHDKADFYKCFTGSIDENVARQYEERLLPIEERPNDIIYRATNLPYWFGSHGQLKHRIADVVREHAQAHGLKCDISTRQEDTIVGDRWLDFLASGRAVIGCESGSSVLDRRGEIQAQIRNLLRENPGLSFEEVSERLAKGWDDYRFFAISPRHFESVITKTCQVLVEGCYDGVLEPEKHYIPLKRDFSNIDDVLEKVRDDRYVKEIAERAYNDIYLSGKYTYRKIANDIERALSKQWDQGRHSTPPPNWLMGRLGYLAGHVRDLVGAEMARAEYGFWQSVRKLEAFRR